MKRVITPYASRPRTALLAAVLTAGLPLVADVSGFDNSINDAFWNTTGRIDVPANSCASSASLEAFSSWAGTFRAASAFASLFDTATSTMRASEAYGYPFLTGPFGICISFH